MRVFLGFCRISCFFQKIRVKKRDLIAKSATFFCQKVFRKVSFKLELRIQKVLSRNHLQNLFHHKRMQLFKSSRKAFVSIPSKELFLSKKMIKPITFFREKNTNSKVPNHRSLKSSLKILKNSLKESL